MLELKKCWKCKEFKGLDQFHRCSERRDGRQTHCKACAKARDYSVYSGPRRLRKRGLSEDDYQKILAQQKNRCLGCDREFDEDEDPCLDHCHHTGIFRGVLCRRCNLLLGLAGDEPATLRALADYLDFAPHPIGV